jgi:hypothetical protein
MPPLVSSDAPKDDGAAGRAVGGGGAGGSAGPAAVPIAGRRDTSTSVDALEAASCATAGGAGGACGGWSSETVMASALGFFALQL